MRTDLTLYLGREDAAGKGQSILGVGGCSGERSINTWGGRMQWGKFNQ